MRRYVTILAALLCAVTAVDACFPGKYWISCLIDTCKLGGKCHADPTASCKMEKSECEGCKPVWYTQTGERANCTLRQNLKLCPNGEAIVHCKIDSCKWPCNHPDFRSAPCRQGYCGECTAEYLIKNSWVRCPKPSTGISGELLPYDGVLASDCIKVSCGIDVCVGQRCPAVQRAVCRPDGCNVCKPAWYLDNAPVDCETGAFLAEQSALVPEMPPWQRACAPGMPLTPCDYRVCEDKVCRNFPNAVCRPDGCGGCVDTWYVDNKLVDCLSDECPPNVPVVKCVDDPCKYFGHYCPAAECRASQCGKCDAKFFSNGVEIDCAMPPKQCPAGVEPLTCPWYTCPDNICPTNRRLMCRINPCGDTCEHEFIDIYTGEPRLCRVFDGTERHQAERQDRQRQIDANRVEPPTLGGIVEPVHSGVKVDVGRAEGSLGPVDLKPVAIKPAPGLSAQPVLINAGPPITDPDILSLLRSFPHEMSVVPSSVITSALKKSPPLSANIADIAAPLVVAQKQPNVDSGVTSGSDPVTVDSTIPDSVLRKLGPGKELMQSSPMTSSGGLLSSAASVPEVLYPELAGIQSGPGAGGKVLKAVKPKFSRIQNVKATGASKVIDPPVIVETSAPQAIDAMPGSTTGGAAKKPEVVAQGKKDVGPGVPISLNLFSQWATS